jgi:transposase-like protein
MDKQTQQARTEQKKPKAGATPTAVGSGGKKPTPSYSAQQKAEAVLSVWSERRGPSEMCRELGIAWIILRQWQERALEGMLQALESRVNLDKGPALSPRLRQMLQKKAASAFPLQKLQERLKAAANPKAPQSSASPQSPQP